MDMAVGEVGIDCPRFGGRAAARTIASDLLHLGGLFRNTTALKPPSAVKDVFVEERDHDARGDGLANWPEARHDG